MKHKNKIF